MEWCLITTNECPPGGYSYTQPETGIKFSHYDWNAFTEAIRSHREGNSIPLPPDWRDRLKSELCEANMPAWRNFCKRCDSPKGVIRPFSIEAAKAFVKFMGTWLAGGGGYVSQEEAEARANTCLGCEFMTQSVGKCGSCYNAVLEIIYKLVKGRETSQQDKLGSCGVCSCALKVATWMPLKPQWQALDEETKDRFRQINHCWKKMEKTDE